MKFCLWCRRRRRPSDVGGSQAARNLATASPSARLDGNKCLPVNAYEIKTLKLSCPSGTTMCNPLLFGLAAEDPPTATCIPLGMDMTETCAKNDSQGETAAGRQVSTDAEGDKIAKGGETSLHPPASYRETLFDRSRANHIKSRALHTATVASI